MYIFRDNLVWNLLNNFHEDRLINQSSNMNFMSFDIKDHVWHYLYGIRMVVALTRL